MTKYRITYNKFADYFYYGVERKNPILKGFWNKKIIGWKWKIVCLYDCGASSKYTYFHTKKEAKSWIRHTVKRELARKYGYRPI